MSFVELFHDISNRYIIYLCVNKKREKDRSFRWPGLTNDGKCSIEEHEVRTLPYTTGRNGMVWHRVLMAALIGREQSESNSNNPLLLIHVHKILRHFITVTGYMYITKYTLTSAQLRLIPTAKCMYLSIDEALRIECYSNLHFVATFATKNLHQMTQATS